MIDATICISLTTIHLVQGKRRRKLRKKNATSSKTVTAQYGNTVAVNFRNIVPYRGFLSLRLNLVCSASPTVSQALRVAVCSYLYSTQGMLKILFLLKTLSTNVTFSHELSRDHDGVILSGGRCDVPTWHRWNLNSRTCTILPE